MGLFKLGQSKLCFARVDLCRSETFVLLFSEIIPISASAFRTNFIASASINLYLFAVLYLEISVHDNEIIIGQKYRSKVPEGSSFREYANASCAFYFD